MPGPIMYWQKNGEKLKYADDLAWNFPEQKQGKLAIVGGNLTAFHAEVKAAEYLTRTFPFMGEIDNFFPNRLRHRLPAVDTLKFFYSTLSGSFDNSDELRHALDTVDSAVIMGDLSKNSVTAIAISKMIRFAPDDLPLVITRDAVDLTAQEAPRYLMRDNLFLVASMASLQKFFRAIYYPRAILLSQPLLPVLETLHKFTLSYPASVLTLHEGKIICASHGDVVTIALDSTDYSPLTLWSGKLAGKIAIFSMFNKSKPLESMVAAVNHK